ncbi:MAG TPA: hypothetical protein VFZ24_17125 [Longimicrobiales bacterium]
MTMHRVMRILIATALLLLACSRTSAQVPWESPQLLAPGTQRGVSLFYVDYGLRPDDGTGFLLTYRGADAPRGPGFRLSATLPREDDVRLSGGVDVAVAMFRHSPAFPLDVMWTSGFGAGYGDYWSVGLPVGISASREIAGEHVRLQPYTSTRVVLEGFFGPNHPDEPFGLALAADIGVDISLQGSRWLIARTALSLGDRRAMAIGLQITPGGRSERTAVR